MVSQCMYTQFLNSLCCINVDVTFHNNVETRLIVVLKVIYLLEYHTLKIVSEYD